MGFAFAFVVYLMAFVALPAVLVNASRRVARGQKALWTVAVLATSWLGFLVFMAVTEKSSSEAAERKRRRRAETAHLVRDISDHSRR